jgi:hypothetical protein
MNTTAAPIGDLLSTYADVQADIENAETALSALKQRREALAESIKESLTASGADKASAHGLTASIQIKDRAKYNPADWPSIVRWAVESGNDHIVQRRLTDAKVVELIRNGVSLPWGLTVESYRDIRVTRTR